MDYIDVMIVCMGNKYLEKILAECRVEVMRASGRGGQHVNTTDSAVRLTHKPTGLTVKVQKHRSQHKNKEEALIKLREKIILRNKKKKPRIKTKKPEAVKQKILDAKRKRSRVKDLRKKVSEP
ncbi:MAG: peptide chain release factor-like protein [Oligoflexia bacterium]|nr:peptide chain release factor-like protein [Oligoflexia bacterium]